MPGPSIPSPGSRKRKRTHADDLSPSLKSAKLSMGAAASSSSSGRSTVPMMRYEELEDQLRADSGTPCDGDVECLTERPGVQLNPGPPTSNNSGDVLIAELLQSDVSFQFSPYTSQRSSHSTTRHPTQVYSITPPPTPSRPLRSPNAAVIWAGIVGVPPPLPNFGRPALTTLPPADPICLLSIPKMNHIWNSLPTGTFWEFARYAQNNNLDTNDLSETMLVTALIGDTNTRKRSNVEGVEAIRSWDNESTLSGEDSHWLQELDWEAEAIVEDKGRMLGIGVDDDMGDKSGTRYGGRVGFCATLHCKEGHTSSTFNLDSNGQIVLEKPAMRGSCLFTRIWGSHRFLRLKLSNRLLDRISRSPSSKLRKELQDYCSRPIRILGRIYHPLVEKEDTVYYFQYGPDRVGFRAMEDLGKSQMDYGVGKYIGTVEGLLQWWLAPEHNRNQVMSKLTTRIHLGLSDTLPGVFIKPENVTIVPDIARNGFNFTDGAGLMSGSVALACWRRYHPGDYSTPSATQIRISSAKGVVQVDPKDAETPDFNGPYKITLPESMVKIKYDPHRRPAEGPVHGMSIYDAAHCIVCIVKPAPQIYPSRLSGQYMTILSAQGVPDEVFLELQQDSVKEALKVIGDVDRWWDNGSQSRPGVNGRMGLAAALETAGGLAISVKRRDTADAARGLGFWKGWGSRDDKSRQKATQDKYSSSPMIPGTAPDESTQSTGISKPTPAANDIWRRDELSGYSPLKYEALRVAALQGLDIARNNHLSRLWSNIVHDVIRGVVHDLRLPVARSAGGFLQPDWTGTLQEGEIVFIPPEGVVDPDTGFVSPAILGDVVVGRHPALLPTDMRKVRAVNPPPELRHCRGLVIFSTQGSRPLADILAGGDYDGDIGDVIWEPKIVNAFQNAPLELSKAPPNIDSCFEKDTMSVNELFEHLKSIPERDRIRYFSHHLLASVGEPGLYRWYSGMYNKATIQFGIGHPTTRHLAHKFNKLMDAAKSGIRIKPPNYRHDKTRWDKNCDPYWKYQQRIAKPGVHQDVDSATTSYSAPASKFILDVLVDVGSGFLKEQVKGFKEHLQIYQSAEFNTRCQSNTQDEDLTRPWLEALRWAADEPDSVAREAKQAELDSIQASINNCLNRFMKMIVNQIERRTSRIQAQGELSALVRHYADSPDLQSLPLLTTSLPGGDGHVARIKASCAYLLDLERYKAKHRQEGGSPSGFPWKMAMTELGNIKADAGSNEGTVHLPYNVVERVGVHRHFK